MKCDDCANYKPAPAWAKPDPISGLTPRFKPNEPLPDGVVLAYIDVMNVTDDYWRPDGMVVCVWADGTLSLPFSVPTIPLTMNAARSLGLPLAGEELKEGEEAWTDERIWAAWSKKHDGSTRFQEQDDENGTVAHCCGCKDIGLDNLRRFRHGWICRRLTAAPCAKCAEKDAEIKRLKGEVASIGDALRHGRFSDIAAWLARNRGGA